MNGFRMWSLQDLLYVLPARFLQHEACVSTMTFKRRLWSLLSLSRKKQGARELKKLHLWTIFNNLESIFTALIPLPKICTISLSCRLPTYLLHSEMNMMTKSLKVLNPLMKRTHPSSLNLASTNKYNKTHQPDDFTRDNNASTDKSSHDDCNSNLASSLRDFTVGRTMKQIPFIKSEVTMKNIKQQQSRELSQSSDIESRDVKQNFSSGKDENYIRKLENCRKKNLLRVGDKKKSGTPCYSQQSPFSASRDYKSFSGLISDIVDGTNARQTVQKFYSSYTKDKNPKPCDKSKKEYETKEHESKKKCVKGPANCLTRKSVIDETPTCQKDKKLSEPTKKSVEEYCTGKKEPTVKDKKTDKELMKEQIEREYKEIEECKKGVKDKKTDKIKKASADYKPTGLDRVISPCKQEQKKDNFASTANERISSSTSGVVAHKPLIQSEVINGMAALCTKNVTPFNMPFDRSFSTMKANYQDDFAINRIVNDGQTIQNCCTSNNDFLYGDELPLYVEIENEEDEADEYDRITEQSIAQTPSKTNPKLDQII